MSDAAALSDVDRDALLRWRLAIGPAAEKVNSSFALSNLEASSAALLGDLGGLAGEPSRLTDMDKALSFVYDEERRAGLGRSSPYIPKWLAALRDFFKHDIVALVQKDAIERRGLTQLLFEPETLPFLDKNVDLVTTLVSASGLIPDRAKDIARQIVREVVEDLRRKLETEVRSAVLGALRRDRTSPVKVLRNLDWRRTIRANLKGWDRERQRLVPERLFFWANQRRHHEWDVVLAVDQSGSMAESVVYSSVMAAIFASLEVITTRLLFFDTEIVDVTPILSDPVDVIFSTQLGGGTDINRAVAYVQANFIERPEKTLFVLITDLYEGGNHEELIARMRQIVDSRVRAICLLALSDSGRPSYNRELAREFKALNVPCFGCTPRLLVQVMERALKKQDLEPLLTTEVVGS